jgi:hypothetical protein
VQFRTACTHSRGHNAAVRKSIPVRLSAIEEQFASIEKLLKELRKRIESVAEDVRIASGAAIVQRAKRR